MICVDWIENEFGHIRRDFYFEEGVSKIDEVNELVKCKFVFLAMRDPISPMFALQAHLSAMALEEEIAQFNKGNCTTIININFK